jgi:hypothetical protein
MAHFFGPYDWFDEDDIFVCHVCERTTAYEGTDANPDAELRDHGYLVCDECAADMLENLPSTERELRLSEGTW